MKPLRKVASATLVLACACAAHADVVIRLRDGTVHRVPGSAQDVVSIEFTTGAALATVPAQAGQPWVVNMDGNIFRAEARGWQSVPGGAQDIGVGADGSVWVVGTNRVPGGWGLWRFTGSGWTSVDGGAIAITVDPRGEPWIVNMDGQIYHRRGGQWREMPGRATDIAAGADGSVWMVGRDPAPGGHGVYRWSGTDWQKVDGAGSRIAVGPDGNPWVANNEGRIFRRQKNAWVELPGRARDIAVGSGGTAWIIGMEVARDDDSIQYWNGSAWVRVEGAAHKVAVR